MEPGCGGLEGALRRVGLLLRHHVLLAKGLHSLGLARLIVDVDPCRFDGGRFLGVLQSNQDVTRLHERAVLEQHLGDRARTHWT